MASKELQQNRNATEEITFKAPWGVIQAKAWGPDDGIPFLGLHGLGDNANTFDTLAPLLPANIRLVAIDFPGHGNSSPRWPGMPYMTVEYVADVKRVVTQLGWEKFSIIGHSMGGGIGSLYAGTFPKEIENLVLIEMGPPPYASLKKLEPAKILARYALMSNKDAETERLDPNPELVTERQRMAVGQLSEEDAMKRGTKIRENGAEILQHPGLRLFTPFILPRYSVVSILSKMHCAVLVLEGKESQLRTPEELIGVICEHAQFSIQRVLPGGHYMHLEYTERTVHEIKEFLSLRQSPNRELASRSKL